jgi:hypothetical protein
MTLQRAARNHVGSPWVDCPNAEADASGNATVRQEGVSWRNWLRRTTSTGATGSYGHSCEASPKGDRRGKKPHLFEGDPLVSHTREYSPAQG